MLLCAPSLMAMEEVPVEKANASLEPTGCCISLKQTYYGWRLRTILAKRKELLVLLRENMKVQNSATIDLKDLAWEVRCSEIAYIKNWHRLYGRDVPVRWELQKDKNV